MKTKLSAENNCENKEKNRIARYGSLINPSNLVASADLPMLLHVKLSVNLLGK